jgi:hypothetical protein
VTTLFLDESKARSYVVAAAVVPRRDVVDLRKAIAALRMKGQRRIHFAHESDSRRRMILSSLAELGVTSRVYVVVGESDPAARERCLAEVTAEAMQLGASRLVLEQDDSYVEFDRRVIRRQLASSAGLDRLGYMHERATAEPLLWAPDAIAWAWSRGGDWRRRVGPLVEKVRELS